MIYTYQSDVVAKGRAERIGNHQYLMIVEDNKKREFTFPAIDPSDAKRQAEELCKTMNICLRQFSIPDEIKNEHMADLEKFLSMRSAAVASNN